MNTQAEYNGKVTLTDFIHSKWMFFTAIQNRRLKIQ